MNVLSRFRWYRRARGGYWAQVTAPLGLLSRTKWVRLADGRMPTPDHKWEFYPWAQKTMGNGYIDEWYADTPYSAVPLSSLPEVQEAMSKVKERSPEAEATQSTLNRTINRSVV